LTQSKNVKRPSFRAEREFGLVVGGVFVLLGTWWLFRGKLTGVAQVLVSLGTLLVLLGIIAPSVLVYPNKAWMKLAEALSFVSTRIILAFVYFLVLTPIGLTKRAMGWDPLHRRADRIDSYWRPYSQRQRNPRHFEKMF